MFEDSGSEVEVQTTYKTGQEENANCKSKSAPIKGGMQMIIFIMTLQSKNKLNILRNFGLIFCTIGSISMMIYD